MAKLSLPKKSAPSVKVNDADRLKHARALRNERIGRAIQWLTETYPAFAQHMPLAIGVHEQIVADKPSWVSKKVLALARKRWCGSTRYLSNLAAAGAMRHHLDGTPAELVSDEHRANAMRTLEGRHG